MSPRLIATGVGIDSGVTKHAIAYLEAFDDGMIWPRELTYVTFEDWDRTRVSNLLRRVKDHSGILNGVVAIETIVGIPYDPKRAISLLKTKESEGRFRDLCVSMGLSYTRPAVSHGRGVLIGQLTASDAQVKAAIEGIYTTTYPGDDLPAVAAADREHLYDAIVVSMVELYERMAGIDADGVPTPAGPLVAPRLVEQIRRLHRIPGGLLPDSVKRAVTHLRAQEKSDKKTARTLAKFGLAPPPKTKRRIPTRVTAAAGKAKSAATRINNKLART